MTGFKKLALISALGLSAARLFAAEGVLIVQTTTTGTNVRTNQVQIEKDRMRAEMAGANGEKQAMVFDGAKQVLTTINFDKKTYSEMTKADVERMGGQMSDAMAKMKDAMAKMPPAQRAQMEALMAGRAGGAAAAPKPVYRKTGTDKVGRWTCDKYEGYQNTEKVADVCTVDPKALGFQMTDFDITKQLAAFFQSMVPQGADQLFTAGTLEGQGYSGVPVRRITYANGQTKSTTELSEVSHHSFAASSYEVPAGFQKQAGFGGRGGRQ